MQIGILLTGRCRQKVTRLEIPLWACTLTPFSLQLWSHKDPHMGRISAKDMCYLAGACLRETPDKHHRMSSLVIKRTKPLSLSEDFKKHMHSHLITCFSRAPLFNKSIIFFKFLVAVTCLEKTWPCRHDAKKRKETWQLMRISNLSDRERSTFPSSPASLKVLTLQMKWCF